MASPSAQLVHVPVISVAPLSNSSLAVDAHVLVAVAPLSTNTNSVRACSVDPDAVTDSGDRDPTTVDPRANDLKRRLGGRLNCLAQPDTFVEATVALSASSNPAPPLTSLAAANDAFDEPGSGATARRRSIHRHCSFEAT